MRFCCCSVPWCKHTCYMFSLYLHQYKHYALHSVRDIYFCFTERPQYISNDWKLQTSSLPEHVSACVPQRPICCKWEERWKSTTKRKEKKQPNALRLLVYLFLSVCVTAHVQRWQRQMTAFSLDFIHREVILHTRADKVGFFFPPSDLQLHF